MPGNLAAPDFLARGKLTVFRVVIDVFLKA